MRWSPRLVLPAAVLVLVALVTACGGEGDPSPSPLPSISSSAAAGVPDGEPAWAGVVGSDFIVFRSGATSQVVLRMVGGAWRESIVAADGSVHTEVLAVVVSVTCSADAQAAVELRTTARLKLADGRSRRSGRFVVAGEIEAVQPGETRQGWLVFENVDWDALRGDVVPAASRLQVDVCLGAASGTGTWVVDAWGPGRDGPMRRVSVPVLGASVSYMIM